MKSLPRGIRLDNTSPSSAVCNTAHLSRRNAEFASDLALRSPWPVLYSFAYFLGFALRKLASNAFFTILHRSVRSHVKLIVSVSCPAEIVNMVVSRIPVVMRYVGELLIFRNSKESHGNKSVGQPPMRLAGRIAEHISDISKWRDASLYEQRICSPAWRGIRVSPFSRLLPPRANLSKLVDLILLKSCYFFPFNHFCKYGCN